MSSWLTSISWRRGMLALFLLLCCHGGAQAQLPCYGCHGTGQDQDARPFDSEDRDPATGGFKGNHRTHMGATAGPAACGACHVNSSAYEASHRNGVIELTANLNTSPSSATYRNGTTAMAQTTAPVLGTCANVNCHFEQTTPTWGAPPFSYPSDCNRCHGAPPAGGAGGAAGSHGLHDRYYPGPAHCQQCHADHSSSGANRFAHATSAGKRGVVVQLRDPVGIPGGSYAGPTNDYLPSQTNQFGSCSNLYCHSRGNASSGFTPNVTPVWGTPLAADCSGCHGGDRLAASKVSSGSHPVHTQYVTDFKDYAMACSTCHSTTVSAGNRTVADYGRHVNQQVDVVPAAIAGGGSYSANGHQPGGSVGTCTVYCHSNVQNPVTGQGGPTVYAAPRWGASGSVGCGKCHGGEGSFYHGGTLISSGSHTRHLAYDFTITDLGQYIQKCSICHKWTNRPFSTVTDCESCHGTPEFRKHADHRVDVVLDPMFGAANSYQGTPAPGDGFSRCDNTYCHGSGTSVFRGEVPASNSPDWGSPGPLGCSSCHGFPPLYPNDAPKPNSHDRHPGIGCHSCHNGTTTNGTTISSVTKHVNKRYDVAQGGGAVFGYTFSTTQGGSCTNISCHAVDRKTMMWGGACLPPASTTPTASAIEVPVSTTLAVVFSEAMDPGTVTDATFMVNGVTGTVAYDSVTRTALFTPAAPLATSTVYTATITTGARTLWGRAMNADYSWSFTTSAVQYYLNEGFEGGALPSGWSYYSTSPADWRFDNPLARTNNTGGSGKFAIADSNAAGYITMDSQLRTPVLNLSNRSRVELEFKTDFYLYYNENVAVDVSSNGTIGPWTTVWQKIGIAYRGPHTEVIDISPQAAGKTNVVVRFRYYNAYHSWWWELDDIIVRGW